jgi:two-component system response regulator CpxR
MKAMQPAAPTSRILIVDDDRALCALLADYLQREGFVVDLAHDGESALVQLRNPASRPDLLILDVMMPGRDGLDTLRELRMQHRLPVIMLSAKGEPVDRVIGLELGADDYLAKPCLPRELLARVRAQLRRNTPATAANVQVGTLRLQPGDRRAFIDEQELSLTGAEFTLLLALAQRAGELVDKASLTRLALGRELERFDRSIDVHVSRLRHKLGEASAQAPRIESVRGSGYLLIAGAP